MDFKDVSMPLGLVSTRLYPSKTMALGHAPARLDRCLEYPP